jgi:hypothetical protein
MQHYFIATTPNSIPSLAIKSINAKVSLKNTFVKMPMQFQGDISKFWVM